MNKKRQKDTQVAVIAVLAAVILLMSVGFAGYTATLHINGDGSGNGITVPGSSNTWKINWGSTATRVTSLDNVGTASGNAVPTISADTVTIKARLVKPGDTYAYDLTVANTGEIAAVLDNITLAGLSEQQAAVIDFYVTVNNGSAIRTTGAQNASLAVGGSLPVRVVVQFKSDATGAEPALQNDIANLNLTATFHFSQA